MTGQIVITGAISGGNPRAAGAIKQAGGAFRIEPWSEDGDANYKFHLLVEIRNAGPSPVLVPLEIEWGETKYAHLRDHLFASTSEGWVLVRGEIDGAIIRVELNCPPGSTLVSLHPAYRQADHDALISRARTGGARHEAMGKSKNGAPLDLLRFERAGRGRRTILVISRLHPYETAGSYCAEGIVDLLLGDGSTQVLEKYDVAIVPLSNPDGVEEGLCKRVAEGGPNPEKGLTTGDPTAAALKRAVDEVKPAGLLDIHGWMHRDIDGLSVYDRMVADRFVNEFAALAPERQARRPWREGDHTRTPGDRSDLRDYARDQHGAKVVVLSFGWEGRNLREMMRLGASAIQAFARACG